MVTELNKQEATYKEVKLTHRKIVEKKDEYSLRASEVTENQRKLHRLVGCRLLPLESGLSSRRFSLTVSVEEDLDDRLPLKK